MKRLWVRKMAVLVVVLAFLAGDVGLGAPAFAQAVPGGFGNEAMPGFGPGLGGPGGFMPGYGGWPTTILPAPAWMPPDVGRPPDRDAALGAVSRVVCRPPGFVVATRGGQPGTERAGAENGGEGRRAGVYELSRIEAAVNLDASQLAETQALHAEVPYTIWPDGRRTDPRAAAQPAEPRDPVPALQRRGLLEASARLVGDRQESARPGVPQEPRPPQGERGAAAEPDFQAPSFSGPFGSPLLQFGYTFFSGAPVIPPLDNMPVGPDYVLGPGDDLAINIWGSTEGQIVRTVDRSGRIVLPKVGDLRVWGLTFAQADRLIREQLARYYRGFQHSVSMGRLRTIQVHVVGEVCQPGIYTVSALSTMTSALHAAGGPTKLGSLRDLRLVRNHQVVGHLDFYDLLQRGDRSRDFRLEAGDTILVPTIGDVVAVAGEVKRPAIYELRGDVRLADLVAVAGGVTPASYLKRVQIVRSHRGAERVTLDVDLASYYLKDDPLGNPPVNGGDLVIVHRGDLRIYNTVKLAGAVKYGGTYELKPMMRISRLLPAEGLLPDSDLERVEIVRRRPDMTTEILALDLRQAWNGDRGQDVVLQPFDEVTVRTRLREPRIVKLTGQVVRPGRYVVAEGERLSSVLERAGGFTDRAYLRGSVFTRAALRHVEEKQLKSFVQLQEQRILADAASPIAGLEPRGVVASAAVIDARRELLLALANRVAVGRMVVRLDPPEALQGTAADVVLMDGDALDVPERPSSVLVLGAVRNPTSVTWQPEGTAEYYLNRVGGLSKEADRKQIHVVKADGSAVAGFSTIREVEPGDTIVVPAKQEEKIRALPVFRDTMSILASIGTTILSLAALAVIF
jgi:polysaccharide biosynthesis/export protein